MRDYLTYLLNHVASARKAGRTREQVVADSAPPEVRRVRTRERRRARRGIRRSGSRRPIGTSLWVGASTSIVSPGAHVASSASDSASAPSGGDDQIVVTQAIGKAEVRLS